MEYANFVADKNPHSHVEFILNPTPFLLRTADNNGV